MRKTWIILLLVASISYMVSGCSQSATTLPVEEKPAPPDSPTNKPPSHSEQPQNETSKPDAVGKNQPQHETEPVQTPPVQPDHPPFEYPDAVRGIYVTGHSAGGAKFPELVKLLDQSDLNAMVIDIKDDDGWITYPMEGDLAPYSKPFIKDPKALIKTLSDHNIYPIARIVVFKDSVLASKHPDYSFNNKGQLWKNRRGEAFVNPFMNSVWKHNVEIAKQAAKLGFQEIQFDYVRFPEGFEKRDKLLSYSMGEYTKEKLDSRLMDEWKEQKTVWEKQKSEWELKQKEAMAVQRESTPPAEAIKGAGSVPAVASAAVPSQTPISEQLNPMPLEPPKPEYDAVKARVTAVTDFVGYAKKELEPMGVKVSVDIFGYTATLQEAPGIGQNFNLISENVDVISSMIYPSHWGPGYFKIPKPDVDPYRLVQEYVKMEKQKLSQLEKPPISRPWIQDFTAPWLGKGNYISYGKKEVELQIKALNEAGIQEFLIWNAGNNFTPNVDYTPINK